ncbi:hypothetical protein Cni_G15654 [Canna indica]|uniref:Uncharacterized protein n=1 Tax=Canna indica TaxID=4628 RepID=A0AAQ3KER9_9LILI|nr:hypothetical protein Cni_G15654 [Canna indica]
MRKFDPWPVFFKREFNRNWPFLVGFATTGAIIVKFTAGLTGSLHPPDPSSFVFVLSLPLSIYASPLIRLLVFHRQRRTPRTLDSCRSITGSERICWVFGRRVIAGARA